jgi:hypothetical protein
MSEQLHANSDDSHKNSCIEKYHSFGFSCVENETFLSLYLLLVFHNMSFTTFNQFKSLIIICYILILDVLLL